MITKGIQNAIEKKNRLFKKYIKCGDSNKNIFHQEYKTSTQLINFTRTK